MQLQSLCATTGWRRRPEGCTPSRAEPLLLHTRPTHGSACKGYRVRSRCDCGLLALLSTRSLISNVGLSTPTSWQDVFGPPLKSRKTDVATRRQKQNCWKNHQNLPPTPPKKKPATAAVRSLVTNIKRKLCPKRCNSSVKMPERRLTCRRDIFLRSSAFLY